MVQLLCGTLVCLSYTIFHLNGMVTFCCLIVLYSLHVHVCVHCILCWDVLPEVGVAVYVSKY